MRDRSLLPIRTRVRCCFFALLAALFCGLLFPASLRAQDAQPPAPQPPAQGTGKLVVTVKGKGDPASPAPRPITAVVRAESSSTLTTTASTNNLTGIATFENLKPETYTLTVETTEQFVNPADPSGKTPFTTTVVVKAGETATVEIILNYKERVATVETTRLILNPDEFANATVRILTPRFVKDIKHNKEYVTQGFDERIPLNIGNKQNLNDILLSVPGFVRDAVNQLHPRGENSVTTAYSIDGFLVPAMQAGRAAQFFLPDAIDTATTRVGGYAARYGGGSGAIVDLTMRDPGLRPYLDYNLRVGGYNTREFYLNLANSAPLRPKKGQPYNPLEPRLRYWFGMSQRYTDNALETPQSGDQTARNEGASEIFYAKIAADLIPPTPDTIKSINAIVNFSSGRTNLNNRTGLDNSFAGFGQGFGFGGFGGPEFPSQNEIGRFFRQKDNNSLAMVQFHMHKPNGMDSLFAIGGSKTTRTIIDQGTQNIFFIPTRLPNNNSIEYIPVVGNDVDGIQLQADITMPPLMKGIHTPRFGVVYHDIRGTDSYQLTPQSQFALNQLAALDPRLNIVQGFNVAPIIAKKTGYYAGAYGEDTFQLRNEMRFNIGLRIDSYKMDTGTNINNLGGSVNNINKTELSPRINISWMVPQTAKGLKWLAKNPTIIRVSYDRMFAPPDLSQGVVIVSQPGSNGNVQANGVGPQITDLYDLSVEHQFALNQKGRIGFYSKDMTRTLAAEQFIYGLQTDTLAIFNNGNGGVDGAEISYDYLPTPIGGNGDLISGFFSYGNSGSAPRNQGQTNNLGQLVATPFYDWDQQDTITLGASYQFHNGGSAGLSAYFGSGLAASSKKTIFSRVPVSGRDAVNEINVSYSSGPRLWNKRLSADIGIQNLFNSKGMYEFSGAFGSTRFQQGRRVFLGVSGKL